MLLPQLPPNIEELIIPDRSVQIIETGIGYPELSVEKDTVEYDENVK